MLGGSLARYYDQFGPADSLEPFLIMLGLLAIALIGHWLTRKFL